MSHIITTSNRLPPPDKGIWVLADLKSAPKVHLSTPHPTVEVSNLEIWVLGIFILTIKSWEQHLALPLPHVPSTQRIWVLADLDSAS